MSDVPVNGYGEPDIGEEVAEGIANASSGGSAPANPPLPDYAQPQKGSEADESEES